MTKSFENTDLNRRMANAIQLGVVESVDFAAGTARVRIGELGNAAGGQVLPPGQRGHGVHCDRDLGGFGLAEIIAAVGAALHPARSGARPG